MQEAERLEGDPFSGLSAGLDANPSGTPSGIEMKSPEKKIKK
jgi:hypothetical protein